MFGQLNTIANRKAVRSTPVRENGRLYTEVEFDDGTTHRVEVGNPDREGVADGTQET